MDIKRMMGIVGFAVAVTLLVTATAASTAFAAQSPSFATESYSWIDIGPANQHYRSVGLSGVSDGDDGFVGGTTDITIYFFFPFFGVDYSSVYICTNGWFSFNYNIPDHVLAAPGYFPSNHMNGAVVAPLLTDLKMDADSNIRCAKLSSPNRFVIIWEKMHHVSDPSGNPSTFQAIISEDGKITFNYQTVGTTSKVVVGVNEGNGRDGYCWKFGSVPLDTTAISTVTPNMQLNPSLRVNPIPELTRYRNLKVTGETDLTSTLALTLNGVTVPLSFSNIIGGRGFSTPTMSLSEGDNRIVVSAEKLGNSLSKSYAVKLDSKPPLLSVSSPRNNAYYKGEFNLKANCSDTGSGISSLSACADGGNPQLVTLVAGSLYSKAFSSLIDGMHTIVVEAADNAGNTISQSFSIFIDRYRPRILSVRLPSQAKRGNRVRARFCLRESFNTTVRTWAKIYYGKTVIKTIDSRTYSMIATKTGYWNSFIWNGRDGAGRIAKAGRYRAVIWALDRAGNRELIYGSAYITLKK